MMNVFRVYFIEYMFPLWICFELVFGGFESPFLSDTHSLHGEMFTLLSYV